MGQRVNEGRKDEIHTFGSTGQSSKPNVVQSFLSPHRKKHMYFP